MSARLSLPAFAKLNLFLKIINKDKTGYHALHTLFQEISLQDRLHFEKTKGPIRLVCPDPFVPLGSDNLIVQALSKLRRRLKTKEGIRVNLIKRIPMGAGLGGGSSDAAAALIGGWALWTNQKKEPRQLRLCAPPYLFNLAKALGADIPFFLRGGACFATGIGDKLYPLESTPKRWYVLVIPPVHVSTKEAYRLFDQARPVHQTTANGFEPVIYKAFPEVASAAAALKRLKCKGVTLSGSGSSVFGGVCSKQAGEKMAARLRRKNWRAHVVCSV